MGPGTRYAVASPTALANRHRVLLLLRGNLLSRPSHQMPKHILKNNSDWKKQPRIQGYRRDGRPG